MISHVTQFINLNDKDFVIHPKPQNDELLSSWLARVARANEIATTSFTNMHFKEYRNNIIWQRDLDIWCPNSLIKKLAKKSNLSSDTIFEMTLKSYQGKLRAIINGKSRTHFIQSLGNYCHIKKNGGLRFCPRCLKEDKIPYFRKKWRLSFYTACIKHKCFLLDRCPSCKTPLTISKNCNELDFTFCYKCGTDLKSTESKIIDSSSYGLKVIDNLLEILYSGFGSKMSYTVPSVEYFSYLKQINKIIYLWKKTKNILEHEILESKTFASKVLLKNHYEDYMDIEEQYLLYSASHFILSCRNIFEKFLRNNNISASQFYKDFK